ncbi:unnamed protein product [Mycena citricolor]|uniref:Fungal-type protein kinase domain-containing protein n=1 Tax=Mycena citricolor TaxID=2018698 RepID=A0AAD2Q5E1_9AGAR|nr:unnamed protein product [Mycena citricolor]
MPAAELGAQVYQFPADEIAAMLSPKRLQRQWKGTEGPHHLAHFDCLVNSDAVSLALSSQSNSATTYISESLTERDHYEPLAKYLNARLKRVRKACRVIVDFKAEVCVGETSFPALKDESRLLPELNFYEYDRSTFDGIEGANLLNPDLVGINTLQASSTELDCCWQSTFDDHGPNRHLQQIQIAVGVKHIWSELIPHAAAYAHAQLSVNPMRSFSVVIAFNHVERQLRFLIFHRGGLTASVGLHVTDASTCAAVEKVFLSIALWSCREDAGFPSFTDCVRFVLPEMDDVGNADACCFGVMETVLDARHSIRGRNTLVGAVAVNALGLPSDTQNPGVHPRDKQETGKVSGREKQEKPSAEKSELIAPRPSNDELKLPQAMQALTSSPQQGPVKHVILKTGWYPSYRAEIGGKMLHACPDTFGTAGHVLSFIPCSEEDVPLTDDIFLPEPEHMADRLWQYRNATSQVADKSLDHRTMCVHITTSEGKRLETCKTPWDLVISAVHGMLGWLSLFQAGFLHRNVSIVNLLRLDPPLHRPKFTTTVIERVLRDMSADFSVFEKQSEFVVDLGSRLDRLDLAAGGLLPDFDGLLLSLRNEPAKHKLAELAHAVQMAVGELDIGTECRGMIIDGDQACELKDYFRSDHSRGTISGTRRFMSTTLRMALRHSTPYLQSPVDDHESAFWTGLSALLQGHADKDSEIEVEWAINLASHNLDIREAVVGPRKLGGPRELLVSQTKNPFILAMAPFFQEWYKQIVEARDDWAGAIMDVNDRTGGDQPTADDKELRGSLHAVHFQEFAYRGVLTLLRVAKKHRASLQSYGTEDRT